MLNPALTFDDLIVGIFFGDVREQLIIGETAEFSEKSQWALSMYEQCMDITF